MIELTEETKKNIDDYFKSITDKELLKLIKKHFLENNEENDEEGKIYILVLSFAEEISEGSSPIIKSNLFSDLNIANKFISKWNEYYSDYEKVENKINEYKNGDWHYWLEIRKVALNTFNQLG